MHTLVLLIRGVMPSGKNSLSMAKLRDLLSGSGFRRVRTYIQSGNVLVETGLSARETERVVHDLIREQLGPDLTVIARTSGDLEEALHANPFRDGYDRSRVFFVFFAEQPEEVKLRRLTSRTFSPEALAPIRSGVVLYIPGPYGKGTLSAGFLEKELGIATTMRNLNTVSRLAAMSRE